MSTDDICCQTAQQNYAIAQ